MTPSPSPNASKIIHPRAVLESVRKHSCYAGLRASIDLILYALRAVTVLTAIFQVNILGHAFGGFGGLIIGVIVAGIALAISWFLLGLVRDLLGVFIDIADTLVVGHARRSQKPPAQQPYERAIS